MVFVFLFRLTSFSVIISRSIHVILFFFMAECYSTVYMYHIFITHLSVDGHVDCFHALAIVNSAAVNIGVHACFYIRVLSGHVPRSGIAGSYSNPVFTFLSNFPTVFHSGYTKTYIPANSIGRFPLVHILSSIYYLWSL